MTTWEQRNQLILEERDKRIDNLIDAIACKMEYGQLQSALGLHVFLEAVLNHIELLERKIEAYEEGPW